ncbi:methyl-accepting chemotaxis protein [Acetanaerobacterium elongatum]|uniref:Methyl-accepting chemotaxis protein n=1 Tax=Acetanaerobacterium elongatum TaxID=258515 RepID=A0A1G9X3Z1_9FIRM|nr:methyl-accepting chemotaxis protein [Acetanaerobacterium elongatum]SDM91494.1 methyl-accepting chemotaxis protein [Acetanaerobacterium elongatum]
MLKRSLVFKMLLKIFAPIMALFIICAILITIFVTSNVEGALGDIILQQNQQLAQQITTMNNAQETQKAIKWSQYGKNGFYLLVNSANVITASTNGKYDGKPITDYFIASEYEKLSGNDNSEHLLLVNSVPSICAINKIGSDGTKLILTVPMTELSGTSSSIRTPMIIVFILMLVLTFAIVLTATLFIVKPINKIKDAALQIAEGNFYVTVNVRSNDEIGDLAGAIKKTVARLSNYVLYIDEITEVLTAISEGDLSFTLRNEYEGEFSSIKDALLKISDSLNHTISEINTAAEQVTSGSMQVSGASQALSQGSTQQANAVEELSITIKEVNDQVKQNAENAKNANNLSVETVGSVEKCSELMRNMLDAMEQIHSASANIAKIIKVIDDISFQTNILALNAAVEAARAGAAGKGFAVVADEVRNLATKSAQAAKNTTELIESSIAAVGKGVDIAKKTAGALDNIVADCNNSSKLISEITVATNDQATAIMHITQGVEQISAVVETNSATAQQTAAASEELSSQSEMLRKLTSQFKLKGDSDGFSNEEYSDDASSDFTGDDDYAVSTVE